MSDSPDIPPDMDQRVRQLSRNVCDVETFPPTGNRETYHFDATCNHPFEPNHSSAIVLSHNPDTDDQYVWKKTQLTIRFPRVPIDDLPYEIKHTERGDPYPDKFVETGQFIQITEDAGLVGNEIERSTGLKCHAKPIGDSHTHKEVDDIEFYHPHIECYGSGHIDKDELIREVGRASRKIQQGSYDFQEIPK